MRCCEERLLGVLLFWGFFTPRALPALHQLWLLMRGFGCRVFLGRLVASDGACVFTVRWRRLALSLPLFQHSFTCLC